MRQKASRRAVVAASKSLIAGSFGLHHCELFRVHQSWYYERAAKPESDEEEMVFVYLACILDTCSRRCVGWH
ncbi:MAG: hypothetical protein E6J31_11175 [Chloroflexi bacterium]|nr:MAG: hypothetical protein E6J31_11175 [Chloroflexota bacterium]TMD81337.1 MAG: hypothetical protein E6I97_00620 [Chloroflexota bacterium]